MHSNHTDYFFGSDGRGGEKRWKNIIALRNNVFVKGIFFRFIFIFFFFLRFVPRKGNGGKKTKKCKGNARNNPFELYYIYVCVCYFFEYAVYALITHNRGFESCFDYVHDRHVTSLWITICRPLNEYYNVYVCMYT